MERIGIVCLVALVTAAPCMASEQDFARAQERQAAALDRLARASERRAIEEDRARRNAARDARSLRGFDKQ